MKIANKPLCGPPQVQNSAFLAYCLSPLSRSLIYQASHSEDEYVDQRPQALR